MRVFPRIDGQGGAATVAQLKAEGWTRSAIRNLVLRHGHCPFPRVYVASKGSLSGPDRLAAAVAWAGPDALLAGAHALSALGVPVPGVAGVIRFLVPARHNVRCAPGAALVRTARWPRTRTAAGIRVAALERALVDAGRYTDYGFDELRDLTIGVLRERLTTADRVAAELAAGRRNGTRAVRQGLLDFTGGAWSLPEVTLGRLLRRCPWEFVLNHALETTAGSRLGIPDAYLPGQGIAIQVHSRTFHSGRDERGHDRWELTVEGDLTYLEHGVVVVGVTPTRLRDDPAGFLERLGAVVAANADRVMPDVVVVAPDDVVAAHAKRSDAAGPPGGLDQ